MGLDATLVERMSGKLAKAALSKEIARNCGSSLKEGKELLELILNVMVCSLSRANALRYAVLAALQSGSAKDESGETQRRVP